MALGPKRFVSQYMEFQFQIRVYGLLWYLPFVLIVMVCQNLTIVVSERNTNLEKTEHSNKTDTLSPCDLATYIIIMASMGKGDDELGVCGRFSCSCCPLKPANMVKHLQVPTPISKHQTTNQLSSRRPVRKHTSCPDIQFQEIRVQLHVFQCCSPLSLARHSFHVCRIVWLQLSGCCYRFCLLIRTSNTSEASISSIQSALASGGQTTPPNA